MPLPDEAFTITGGCNCGSIRYRIAVPPLAQRPPDFTSGPDAEADAEADADAPGPARLPQVINCHCGDCRAASGQPSMAAVVTPGYMVTVSALPLSAGDAAAQAITGRVLERPTSAEDVAADDDDKDDDEDDDGKDDNNNNRARRRRRRPAYVPAVDVLRPGAPGARGTTLRFFHSYMCDGEVASRSFCVRCGGPVAFHYRPKAEWLGARFRQPDGWEDVVDVLLGTVDAHVLDKDEWLRVEHELFWGEAIGWVKRDGVHGKKGGVSRHPAGALGEVIAAKDALE